MHVSNFRPIKRLSLLVEAFAALSAEQDAMLWLVGDGPERRATQRAIEAAGLVERVVWWGSRGNVSQILADADIAMLASAYESFSLFALEAMAAALPVVAFDVGGISEVVEHGVTGLLVRSGDTTALAAAVTLLLRDPARRIRMGQAARQSAQKFSEQAVVCRYEALYHALCRQSGRERPVRLSRLDRKDLDASSRLRSRRHRRPP